MVSKTQVDLTLLEIELNNANTWVGFLKNHIHYLEGDRSRLLSIIETLSNKAPDNTNAVPAYPNNPFEDISKVSGEEEVVEEEDFAEEVRRLHSGSQIVMEDEEMEAGE